MVPCWLLYVAWLLPSLSVLEREFTLQVLCSHGENALLLGIVRPSWLSVACFLFSREQTRCVYRQLPIARFGVYVPGKKKQET